MKKTLTTLIVLASIVPLISSCGDGRKQVREIPLEDFFRNSERSSYEISPTGEYFSYMAPYESRSNIFIQKVGEQNAVRITSETERDIAGYAWINDNRLVFLKDTNGDENFQLYGVNLDGADLKVYTPAGTRVGIIDMLEDQPDFIIISSNQRNPEFFDPYRLNLVTGEMTMLAENPGYIQGWQTDHDGKLRVAYALDGVNTTILYRDTEEEEFRPVHTSNFKERLSFNVFTADNKEVYASSNIGRDKTALVRMNPATCEEIEELYTNDKYDLGGVNWSDKEKKLLSVAYVGHKNTVRHYFDDEYKAKREKLEKHFKDAANIGIASQNRNEDIWIVYEGSDKSRGAYFVYDTNTDKLEKIADVAPWINADEMADVFPVTYTSRDGLTIEGYLTLPAGLTPQKAKNLPVIINPHGGPWARDYWGYNPEVQFFANRGYGVLQMNFRGSTGFGRNFWELSFKQWGQTMQDDITDGVQWLVDQGIADPKKVAIYGASYGGYATLMGVVKTPDLYACAVDYVGVSNLFTFMETIPPYWKPMLDMMYEQVGDPQTDSLMMAQNSPALQADKITAPLFVVQGAHDPRVNKDESDQMVEALRKRGVDVKYMVKYNEGHGFHLEENQFELYREMEKFFAEHLKGVKPEAAPEAEKPETTPEQPAQPEEAPEAAPEKA